MNTDEINVLLERAGCKKAPVTVRVWNFGGRHGLGKQVESLQNTLMLCSKHRQALAAALKNVLDERDALLENVPKWISVKERLPKVGTWFFTYSAEDGISVFCKYDGDGKWFATDDKDVTGYITHWMPLPEPPKENKEENKRV